MDYKILLLSLLAPNYFGLYIKPYKFVPYTRAVFNENKSGSDVKRTISHKNMSPQEYEDACDDLKKYYDDLDEYYRDLKKRLSDINKNVEENKNSEDDESGEYLLPL
tara:strand:+ start:2068 stop:2388 length:321 start_codon:yes stop_codon:yes gene_type:complete